MLSSLSAAALPAAPVQAAPATATGTGADAAAGEGSSFSQALEQASAPRPAGAAPAAARTRGGAAAQGAAAPVEPGRVEAAAGAETTGPALQGLAEGDRGGAETDTHEPGPPVAVAELLADLQARAAAAPVPAAAAAAAQAGSATEAGTDKGASRGEALRGTAAGRSNELPGTAVDRHHGVQNTAPGRGDSQAAAQAAAQASALVITSSDRQPPAAEAALGARAETAALALTTAAPGSASALGSGFAAALSAATATGAAAAPPPAEATLSAHPASPAFGQQLGATLSTFVRQGIEHARLHLNPAELGPVQVQIQLDGANAQILLGADNALTRQALEQSLPLLAGTLREAGLTLAGGGVFEQARQGGGEPGGRGGAQAGAAGRDADTGEPLEAPPRVAVRHRGVVDLVA